MIDIRWLIPEDLPEVIAIENACFPEPWTELEFLTTLRRRNTIGNVATVDRGSRLPVGYMIYEVHKSVLNLVSIAVSPPWRRKHIGREMIQRLIDKLSQQRRCVILATVRERNLDAQLFFRSCGFRADQVLRNHYRTGESAYRMRYVRPVVATPEKQTATR